ncbi:MAG: hypothetical protein IKD06_06855 [Clostridia bacterium]|nr:hypothetical protein [Clostridia bacterium]
MSKQRKRLRLTLSVSAAVLVLTFAFLMAKKPPQAPFWQWIRGQYQVQSLPDGINRLLNTPVDQGSRISLEVSADNVRALLRQAEFPTKLYWSFALTRGDGTLSRTQTVRLWISGNRFRLEQFGEDGSLIRLATDDGTKFVSTYVHGENRFEAPSSQSFDAVAEAGAVSLTYFLSAYEPLIQNASLVKTASDTTIELTFEDRQLQQTETYAVSLTKGIVPEASVISRGKTVYQLTTLEAVTDFQENEEMFNQ